MALALVLGVNGQDGSFIAEELLSRGHQVYGVGRQPLSRWITGWPNYKYVPLDLRNIDAYGKLLTEIQPQIICNFSAMHGSSGFIYENHWKENLEINSMIMNSTLEFQRINKHLQARSYFLSSSKAFCHSENEIVTEKSNRCNSCLYSMSKNLSSDLILYYRKTHSVYSSIFWTFNHESYRRSTEFFVPKVADALASAILGRHKLFNFQNLDFSCDWGDAREYMGILADIIHNEIPGDFVIATGNSQSARGLVETLFDRCRISAYDWIKVSENQAVERQDIRADISKLARIVGRTPKLSAVDVCLDILRFNYDSAFRKYQEMVAR